MSDDSLCLSDDEPLEEVKDIPVAASPNEKLVQTEPIATETPAQPNTTSTETAAQADCGDPQSAKDNITEDESSSHYNDNGKIKSKKQIAKEKAFKKTNFAENDPVMLAHRQSRRELAQRLENDEEFRKQYIENEKRLREQKADESSVVDDNDVEDAIKTIHKHQGDLSDDEVNVVDGISDDGSVISFDVISASGKPPKVKKAKKSKKAGGKSAITIKKLVIKKLVLNF